MQCGGGACVQVEANLAERLPGGFAPEGVILSKSNPKTEIAVGGILDREGHRREVITIRRRKDGDLFSIAGADENLGVGAGPAHRESVTAAANAWVTRAKGDGGNAFGCIVIPSIDRKVTACGGHIGGIHHAVIGHADHVNGVCAADDNVQSIGSEGIEHVLIGARQGIQHIDVGAAHGAADHEKVGCGGIEGHAPVGVILHKVRAIAHRKGPKGSHGIRLHQGGHGNLGNQTGDRTSRIGDDGEVTACIRRLNISQCETGVGLGSQRSIVKEPLEEQWLGAGGGRGQRGASTLQHGDIGRLGRDFGRRHHRYLFHAAGKHPVLRVNGHQSIQAKVHGPDTVTIGGCGCGKGCRTDEHGRGHIRSIIDNQLMARIIHTGEQVVGGIETHRRNGVGDAGT